MGMGIMMFPYGKSSIQFLQCLWQEHAVFPDQLPIEIDLSAAQSLRWMLTMSQ